MPNLPGEIEEALALLRAGHGIDFLVLGRYGEGEFGAFRVQSGSGQRYALKVSRPNRVFNAVTTTAALLRQRYPAPRYVGTGALRSGKHYALIEELPGTHPTLLGKPLTARLIELVDAQAGRACVSETAMLVDTLLVGGGEGYCDHAIMRSHSAATLAFLNEIIAIGRASASIDFSTTDVMHFDFHLGNLLTEAGEVTGVVDWDGTCSGDRAFDLATLLFYTYHQEDAREILWRALLERAGWRRSRVYLAHVMLRQTAWSAAHHGRQAVAGFLATSRAILENLDTVSG